MKKKTVVVCMVAALCFGVFPLFANGQSETGEADYVIASNCEWPPLEFVDENGEVVGFEIDLVKEIARVSGKTFTIRNVAWDGIFAGLSNGAYDGIASGVSVLEERKQTMDFTTPVLLVTQAILSSADAVALTDIDALKGLRVGVQIGTTGQFALEDRADLEVDIRKYDDIPLAVEDLINGNVDAVVCDSIVASDYVLSNENYRGKLAVTGTATTDIEEIAMCVKKGNSELLGILNDSIAQLEEDGTLDTLKAKWHLL